MRRLPFYFFLLLLLTNLHAQKKHQIPPEKPKLIIGIVVEQMRYDYIFRYWDKFSDKGFKKLFDGGTFCKNAHFNYLFTQSDVGQATISTGAMPADHGIISNVWYNRRKKEMVYSVLDKNEKTIQGNYASGQFSPRNLLSTTYQDELKIYNYHKSKAIGIALKGSSAILSSGMLADAAYWYDPKNGDWISSTYYLDSLPDWVNRFNEKRFPDIYLEREWNPLLPLEDYTESLPDDNEFEKGIKGVKSFPYNLEQLSQRGRGPYDKNYSLLLTTPYANVYTKDFALHCIMEEQLGQDEYTDVLTVSFSANDFIGRSFGPSSVEIEDAYLRLDKNIEHFIKFVDDKIGMENVLVYLTSNHGVAHIPDYLKSLNIQVDYFNARSTLALLKSYLNVVYGKADWIQAYYGQQFYLDRDLIEDSDMELEEIQDRVARFLVQFEGVSNSLTASSLLKTNYSDGMLKKIQNSYNQKRSGDILVNLRAGWVEKDDFSTSPNSANAYDTHVPLVWYGWKMKRETIIDPVDMTEIAPTIAFFLNIAYPTACTGRPILKLID